MNNNVELINALNRYLSNIAVLISKMYNYHWNVEDPLFLTIHEKTEDYYETLLEDYDEVAERIKSLGGYPITSLKEYSEIATIKCAPSRDYDANEIINSIIKDFEILLLITDEIEDLATKLNDLYTIDLMTMYASFLEKELWMLRSQI